VVELVRHPGSGRPPVRSLQARACLLDSSTLSLGFTLLGDLDRLAFPPQAAPERTDGLWEHTCFEAFLALEGVESYHEVNLSPSGAWASYTFLRYREGGSSAEALVPHMVVHLHPDRLELHALLGLGGTLDWQEGRHLRLGLSAVLEQKGGELSYWAIRHPEGRPDFHHPRTFALELSPLIEEA
jgi:hypothetical protein